MSPLRVELGNWDLGGWLGSELDLGRDCVEDGADLFLELVRRLVRQLRCRLGRTISSAVWLGGFLPFWLLGLIVLWQFLRFLRISKRV